MKHKVHVTKDYLVFSAGHFITFNGDNCERLHGHNYRVGVEIEGPLDENHYVLDFIALRDHTRAIVDELDHRMLLPLHSEYIKVEVREKSVYARYKDREWMFPRDDCVLLPIPSTTSELLAQYIGDRLLAVLREKHDYHPEVLRVEVEECFGQSATCEWENEG